VPFKAVVFLFASGNNLADYFGVHCRFFCFRMALSARQNYSEECEAAVNKQVNGELCAMYTYMAMVSQISDVQTKLLEKLVSE